MKVNSEQCESLISFLIFKSYPFVIPKIANGKFFPWFCYLERVKHTNFKYPAPCRLSISNPTIYTTPCRLLVSNTSICKYATQEVKLQVTRENSSTFIHHSYITDVILLFVFLSKLNEKSMAKINLIIVILKINPHNTTTWS